MRVLGATVPAHVKVRAEASSRPRRTGVAAETGGRTLYERGRRRRSCFDAVREDPDGRKEKGGDECLP